MSLQVRKNHCRVVDFITQFCGIPKHPCILLFQSTWQLKSCVPLVYILWLVCSVLTFLIKMHMHMIECVLSLGMLHKVHWLACTYMCMTDIIVNLVQKDLIMCTSSLKLALYQTKVSLTLDHAHFCFLCNLLGDFYPLFYSREEDFPWKRLASWLLEVCKMQ